MRGRGGGDEWGGDPGREVARGIEIGFLAYAIWGLLTIYWKQLDGFGAIELVGWRMVCAAVVMTAITTARGSWPVIVEAFRDRVVRRRLIAAAVLLTGNWGSYVWAVINDRVVETALGYFMAPLATMAIGVFVLHEEPTRAQRVAFALAAVAVVVLTVSYGRPPWIAFALAGSWSMYGLSKRRTGLGAVDSLTGETLVTLIPAVALLAVLSGDAGSVVQSAAGVDVVFVLGTGIVTAVPLMMFARAARIVPFTLLGPLNLLVPVINFGLGWLLYDEPMPLDRVVGFAFVWIALLVVMSDRIRSSRRATVPLAA